MSDGQELMDDAAPQPVPPACYAGYNSDDYYEEGDEDQMSEDERGTIDALSTETSHELSAPAHLSPPSDDEHIGSEPVHPSVAGRSIARDKYPSKQAASSYFAMRYEHPDWRVFGTLDLAMKSSDSLGGVPVFGMQTRKGIQVRKFVVTGYKRLWKAFDEAKDVTFLSFHEIIFGPQNIYFDAEFKRLLNRGIRSDGEIIHRINQAVIDTCDREFSIIPVPEEMIGAVSSDETKFSYHLVVRLLGANAILESWEVAREFAKQVVSTAMSDRKYWLFERTEGCEDDESMPKGFDIHADGVIHRTQETGQSLKKSVPVIKSIIDPLYKRVTSLRTFFSTKLEEAVYRPVVPFAYGTNPPLVPMTPIQCKRSMTRTRFLNGLIGYVDTSKYLRRIINCEWNEKTGAPSFNKVMLEEEAKPIPTRIRSGRGDHAVVMSADKNEGKARRKGDAERHAGPAASPWVESGYAGGKKRKKAADGVNVFNMATREDNVPAPGYATVIGKEFVTDELGLGDRLAIKYNPEAQLMVYGTRCSDCPFAGRRHGSSKATKGAGASHPSAMSYSGNHLYVVLFINKGYAVLKCHSEKCDDKSKRIELPPKLLGMVRDHAKTIHRESACLDRDLGGLLGMLA